MTEFILALFQKKNKLKLTTLYQVLIGKKTSSVISYAFFMDLLPYLGSFPKLDENEFTKIIQHLVNKNQLIVQNGLASCVSEQDSFLMTPDYLGLNYFRFGHKDVIAWRLIQFFIQNITNEQQSDQFVSLETTPYYLATVKRVEQQFHDHPDNILYQELSELFSQLPEKQSDILVATLSGGEVTGQLFYQVYPQVETIKGQLYIASAWHKLLTLVLHQPESLLYQLIKQPLFETLNRSLLVTRKLWLQQYSIEEIAHKRRLKPSTIRDHLIEWAILDPIFPFESFDFTRFEAVNFFVPVWEVTYSQLSDYQLEDSDFLLYRLFQIKRKREADGSIRT